MQYIYHYKREMGQDLCKHIWIVKQEMHPTHFEDGQYVIECEL